MTAPSSRDTTSLGSPDVTQRSPTLADVASVWWPLSASWLLMAVEVPMVSAALARLPEPAVQLAAFGGIVFPILLLIESPVIMLLAASTALSRDRVSYDILRRYVLVLSVGLSLLHLLVVLTPAYDLVTRRLIGAPPEIVDPARLAMLVGLPWTAAIAYRRFDQGVLIRFGASRAVGVGTAVRLVSGASVLVAGLLLHGLGRLSLDGVVLGSVAVIAGVVAECAYIQIRTRPVVEERLPAGSPGADPPVTPGGFLRFYVPLALTSLLGLIVQPLGSAALSRMPRPLESLAAWPVVWGLLFMLRSPGTAYKEVVVAMMERPRALAAVRRFTLLLTVGVLLVSLAVTFTPLAHLWLGRISGLDANLTAVARAGLLAGVLIPALGALQNTFTGYLVWDRRTRRVTESMVAFLGVAAVLLFAGVAWGGATGLVVALATFTAASAAQLLWVWLGARRGFSLTGDPDTG